MRSLLVDNLISSHSVMLFLLLTNERPQTSIEYFYWYWYLIGQWFLNFRNFYFGNLISLNKILLKCHKKDILQRKDIWFDLAWKDESLTIIKISTVPSYLVYQVNSSSLLQRQNYFSYEPCSINQSLAVCNDLSFHIVNDR